MNPTYEIVVRGNSLRLRQDFLGLANVTLIGAREGYILFDTGGYISRLGLLEALDARGIKRDEIKTVFLSHLHFDHAHNIDLFPHARFLLGRSEWEYVGNTDHGDLLIPWGIREQLSKCKIEFLDGECPIDAGVSCFPAPGHTPGSYGMELDTSDFGRVIIAGDAIKYVREVVRKRPDTSFDPAAGERTIQRILDRADRIIPGHFPELIHQPDGSFAWDDVAELDLRIR